MRLLNDVGFWTQLGPVGMSTSAPLLGRKQTSAASLKLGPIRACPFLIGPFHWQQKLNKCLFYKAVLHFSSRWKKCWTPGPHDFAVRIGIARRAIPTASIASRLNVRDDAYAPHVESGCGEYASFLIFVK